MTDGGIERIVVVPSSTTLRPGDRLNLRGLASMQGGWVEVIGVSLASNGDPVSKQWNERGMKGYLVRARRVDGPRATSVSPADSAE